MPRRRSHIIDCGTDMVNRKKFDGNPKYTSVLPNGSGLSVTTDPSPEWDWAFGEGASEQFNDPLYEPSESYEMEDTDLVDSPPVPLRRSERLRPFYVDREVEPAGHNIHETREKLVRNQRLLLRYSFSSSDDSDVEAIPAQEAHSHDSYVRPDNRVHGPGCNCAEFYMTYCAEYYEVALENKSKTSTKRAIRWKQSRPNRLSILPKRASRRKQSRPNRSI